MDAKTHRGVCRLVGWTLCLLVATAWAANDPAVPLLWREMSDQASQGRPFPPKKPWVIREREIVLDPQLLALLKNAAARPIPPIAIDLFHGHAYELDVSSSLARLSDISTVRGSLKHVPKGSWSLIISGNVVNGTVQVGDRLYKIEHVFNGRHRLLEVDPAKMPPD
ncbi:MAG: protein of unknown function [Nitrospira sp.]